MRDEVVGRQAELESITSAIGRPDLAGVVLIGEPGIGKTHLLEAALRRGREVGFATERIAGTRALADLPLGAFASLLPGRPSGDVGDLVSLRDELRARAIDRPILLGVDDAHLLDDASAAVVHQLACDLTVFVIGTVRAGVIPPDAVTALWKDRLADRVEIGALGHEAMARLVESRAGAVPEPDVTDAVWRRSGGNPLFAVELLQSAIGAGSIVVDGGRLSMVGELPTPTSVTELLGARLVGLDPAERSALDLLAVGGTLDVTVMEELVHPDALVRLEGLGLLVADETGSGLDLRFAHPLLADAVLATTGRLVVRQLRRRLADALEARGGAQTDEVLRIVTLRLESGGSSPPPMLTSGALIAMRRQDHALAERLARVAYAEQPTLPIACLIAQACTEQGRAEDAITALTDPAIDRTAARPTHRVVAAALEAQIRFWSLGDAPGALDRLAAIPPDDAADHQRHIDGTMAAIHAGRGDVRAALALTADPATADTEVGAAARIVASVGAGEPILDLDDDLLTRFAAAPGWSVALSAHVFALAEVGRVDDARSMALDLWEEAVRRHSPHGRVGWAIALGTIELTSGRLDSAGRWFDEAARLAPFTAATGHGRRWALGGALVVAMHTGDRDAADRLAAELEQMTFPGSGFGDLLGLQGLAWRAALVHGSDVGVARLEQLASEAIADGRIGDLVHIATDIARLGHAASGAALLDRVASGGTLPVTGDLLPTLIDGVRALAANDVETLSATADRLAQLGAGLLAAEAAAAAFALAEAAGEEQRALATRQRRAQELRAGVGTAFTPALAAAPTEIPLSRREREIATLVAEGRTSREVAEHLVIGVRTVESHLARVFRKLGISSRAELAEALQLGRTLEGSTT